MRACILNRHLEIRTFIQLHIGDESCIFSVCVIKNKGNQIVADPILYVSWSSKIFVNVCIEKYVWITQCQKQREKERKKQYERNESLLPAATVLLCRFHSAAKCAHEKMCVKHNKRVFI